MSSFAIDASIALAWCFDDEATEATRALLDRFGGDQSAQRVGVTLLPTE